MPVGSAHPQYAHSIHETSSESASAITRPRSERSSVAPNSLKIRAFPVDVDLASALSRTRCSVLPQAVESVALPRQ